MTLMGPLAIVLSVGVVLVCAFIVGPRLFRGAIAVRRSFHCPFRDQNVSAEFAESAWDGERADVTRCSAFDPPTAVACEKQCLGLERFETVR
jgi:hypothetical protein